MNGEQISNALGGVNEAYVRQSMPRKKKGGRKKWLAAVAAVLVVAICIGIFLRGGKPVSVVPVPGVVKSYAIKAPVYPESVPYPASEMAADAWVESRKERYAFRGAGKELVPFMERCAAEMFGNRQENTVFSPISAFLAAAMLAELTGGETQKQLLAALGAEDLNALRKTAHDVWNANYCNDGAITSILGSAAWMGDGISYNEAVLQTLAQNYYAASFSGSFAEKAYTAAMAKWINEQTGDLLRDAVDSLEIPPETVFVLLSTMLFRAKWQNEFEKSETRPEVFHALSGDETADFMHQTFVYGEYYWGERFGAVRLALKEGGEMWFFLPDEGSSPADLYKDPEALALMSAAGDWQAYSEWEKQKSLRVNLSLPKFDVSSNVDLKDIFPALGVTDCFSYETADFGPLTNDDGVYVSGAPHAARVAIDEEGVVAAAFTAMIGCGAAMPPEEEMDFVLDRPFAFVVAGLDTLPLFEGAVYGVNG